MQSWKKLKNAPTVHVLSSQRAIPEDSGNAVLKTGILGHKVHLKKPSKASVFYRFFLLIAYLNVPGRFLLLTPTATWGHLVASDLTNSGQDIINITFLRLALFLVWSLYTGRAQLPTRVSVHSSQGRGSTLARCLIWESYLYQNKSTGTRHFYNASSL